MLRHAAGRDLGFSGLCSHFVFFSLSTKRWVILSNRVTITLKPLSNTRWSTRIDSLKQLKYQLSQVHEALKNIYDDEALTGAEGVSARAEAEGLAKSVSSYKFIAALIIWHDILFQINNTNQSLQKTDLDMVAAVEHINQTRKILSKWRNDDEFEGKLVDAQEICENMGILPSFASEHRPTRLRKVPQLNDNEAEDQPIEDPKQKFKVEFYFIMLDTDINSLSEGFSQFDFMSKTFGVLFDLHNIHDLDESSLTEKCEILEQYSTRKNYFMS